MRKRGKRREGPRMKEKRRGVKKSLSGTTSLHRNVALRQAGTGTLRGRRTLISASSLRGVVKERGGAGRSED